MYSGADSLLFLASPTTRILSKGTRLRVRISSANRIEIEQGCPRNGPSAATPHLDFHDHRETPADFHDFAHDDGDGAAVRSVRRTVGSGLSLKGHRSRPSVNCLWKRDAGWSE